MLRNLKTLLCFVLVVIMLVGCTPTSTTPTTTEPAPTDPPDPMTQLAERLEKYAQLGTSPDDNYRTWYEIFVYSFCDSNGDGIGDLQGVISKLDYLQELGINGIWLMPIHPSSSYHKYDVNNYYDIDKQYGTMADFDALMAECEKRDIHVILDLVVNHTGSSNSWFTQACKYLKGLKSSEEPNVEDCQYYDYFNFTTKAQTGYNRVPGSNKYYYECQFSSSMPDLNWDSELMRQDVKNVMEFWLNKGVAGFRVDAAKEFYSGAVNKNVEVMNWLQKTAESIKPDAYMVAEVWENGHTIIADYYNSDFTSIFNYAFGDFTGKLTKVVNGRGNAAMVTTWAKALEVAHKAYAKSNPDYIDAPFLSNHDVGRIYGFVSGDEMRIKMAGAMNLFMSGSAFIYYGEEIGMPGSGNDPSKRAPMYWNAERDDGTTKLPPQCVLPEDGYPMGSLEEQKLNANSVYNYYRQAIAIRKALPVISHGVPAVEAGLNKGCVSAVQKTWNDQKCIILMNIDDNEAGAQVDLSNYADWTVVATLSATGDPVEQDGTTLKMPAYGIAVLTPSK